MQLTDIMREVQVIGHRSKKEDVLLWENVTKRQVVKCKFPFENQIELDPHFFMGKCQTEATENLRICMEISFAESSNFSKSFFSFYLVDYIYRFGAKKSSEYFEVFFCSYKIEMSGWNSGHEKGQ